MLLEKDVAVYNIIKKQNKTKRDVIDDFFLLFYFIFGDIIFD